VLHGHHPASGETATVADPFDLVDNRGLRVAGEEEVGVQGMSRSLLHGGVGSQQRLAEHLPAEDGLAAQRPAFATEAVFFQRFEGEMAEQVLHEFVYGRSLARLRA